MPYRDAGRGILPFYVQIAVTGYWLVHGKGKAMKHDTIGRLASIAIALGLLTLAHAAGVIKAQSGAEVGAAPGKIAFEFVGQVDQNALDITAYGYLTHVNGLPDAQLFTKPDPTSRSEATARFTFMAKGKLSGRYTLQNLIDTDTALTMTIYFSTAGGANFAKQDLFAAGAPIATLTVQYQQILIVEAPNTGIVSGSGESTQETSGAFTLNNQPYQFGHGGLIEHFPSFGSGKRTEATAPKSQFAIAGSAMVIDGTNK
jgi:hypothetical protein